MNSINLFSIGRGIGFVLILLALTISAVSAEENLPLAMGDTFTTPVNQALTITQGNVLVNDLCPVICPAGLPEGTICRDPCPVTAQAILYQELDPSIETPPFHGSVVVNENDGSFTYTPEPGYEGTDEFDYYIIADGLQGELGDVTINVVSSGSPPPVVDPPTVDAGDDQTSVEGTTLAFSGEYTWAGVSDPVIAWDFGDGALRSESAATLTPAHTYADNGVYVVTLTMTDPVSGATDSDTLIAHIANAPPVVTTTVPADPVAVGAAVTATGSFTDPGTEDFHVAEWAWGDGTTSAGDIRTGTVSGTHAYAAAGVYEVTLTVIDDDGGIGSASAPAYLVVYDPDAGFVTGGGWIDSPAGAYAADPAMTGRANFGFVARYKKGATVPDGQTEFQFHAARLNFHSTAYEWLVVAGAKAQFKGTGTVNGNGNYGFTLTAVDGQVKSKDSPDLFRIRITDLSTGAVVYDNHMGASDSEDPVTAISGGSIVIHKG